MIINLKSQTDLSGFYVVYSGSTLLETTGYRGVMHLLEHLVCKSFDHLQEEFDKDGIDWNAYTSTNEVVFYMTGLDEKVENWKYTFVELLNNFNITKEQFLNEKKIVLEEYSDCFNDQTSTHGLNLLRRLYNFHNPIGNRKDLEDLTYENMIKLWQKQFTKPSKIINVSKNSDYVNNSLVFNTDVIDFKIEKNFYDVDLELENQYKDKSSIIMLMPLIESQDMAYVNFINSMLGLGLSSPLYKEVREKNGLVYYIQCYLQRVNNQGINRIATLTSNKNYDEVVSEIENVIKNPDTYLTIDRFNIVKDYYTVRKQKDEILRYENVIAMCVSPENWQVYNILDTVTIEKIREVYDKYFNYDTFYISNDKTEFSK